MLYVIRYTFNAAILQCRRKIRLRTLLLAMRERPIAVCGPRGSYVLDPDFEKDWSR